MAFGWPTKRISVPSPAPNRLLIIYSAIYKSFINFNGNFEARMSSHLENQKIGAGKWFWLSSELEKLKAILSEKKACELIL